MKSRYEVHTFVAIFILATIFVLSYVSAAPNGATVTPGTPQTANTSLAGNASAQAGNITYLGLYGLSTTQSWQGYYGNVTGVIQLADTASNVMYNWSLASPSGEVYASNSSSIVWTNIQCFNYTAAGNFTSDDGNGGTTNRHGINLTTLEGWYGINNSDVDGVNETFTFTGASTHDAFITASQSFSEGECYSTRIYNETAPVSNQFEEVLLYEPNTTSVVFASILEKNIFGFNDQTNDFEMIVLENGHNGDTNAITYFFYVELE